MFSIIIDFTKIIKHSGLTLLESKIKPFPTFKHNIGLILTIPSSIHDKLLEQPIGQPRIDFINSPAFVDSIIDFLYMQYEPRSKICELQFTNENTVSSILDSLLYYIPNDFKILTYTSIQNKLIINKLITHSFRNPYIANKSQLDYNLQNDMLFMCKINNIDKEYDATNDIAFTISKYKNRINTPLQFKFDTLTIKKLKKLSRFGSSLNSDGTISQKEIVGCFNLKRIEKINENFIHILQLCDESFTFGTEEEVNNIKCRFSFHTHPFNLYDVYKFKLAWPSNADYIGYLSSVETGTLFHIVVGNEGIYIISLTEEWIKNGDFTVSKDLKKFIIQNFKFKKSKPDITLKSYIRKVNDVRFQNKQIFNIEFKSWDEIQNPFSVCDIK